MKPCIVHPDGKVRLRENGHVIGVLLQGCDGWYARCATEPTWACTKAATSTGAAEALWAHHLHEHKEPTNVLLSVANGGTR